MRFTDTKSYFVSEASVYRLLKAHDLITSPAFIVMKAADEFKDKTTAPNQLWQTDFTYLKVIGWGWFYLSHHPGRLLALHHRLEALHDDEGRGRHGHAGPGAAGLGARSGPRRSSAPTALAITAPSYISADLAKWLDKRNMEHVRGAPCHPQTQGKIERWHQTLKNRILLENYYLPGDLEARIAAFVEHYNHRRYHESLDNLTPADVYFGRGQTILLRTRKDQTSHNPKPPLATPNSKPHKINHQMSRILH